MEFILLFIVLQTLSFCNGELFRNFVTFILKLRLKINESMFSF